MDRCRCKDAPAGRWPMRIGVNGIFLEGKRTGIGRYLESLLREWASIAGPHEIVLYYLEDEPSDHFLDSPVYIRTKLSFPGAGQGDMFEWELLNKPVDIFFSALYDLPYSLRSPAVITIHDMIHEACPESFNDIQLQYLREKTQFGARTARRIITDSYFSLREIARYFPEAESRISVIPLAPSPIFVKREVPQDFLQGRFGVSGPYMLYVGAITPKRHIRPLVDAFSALYPRHSRWNLIAIGRNVTFPREDLHAMVGECNEKLGREAVIYREFVDDETLVYLYNAAELFVYLSTYEGFGMPPLEAMACGTPVVTTHCCSLPEVVGDAAMMVNPLDHDEVVSALDVMMKDETMRDRYRGYGYAQRAKFSWQTTALNTFAIIRDSL